MVSLWKREEVKKMDQLTEREQKGLESFAVLLPKMTETDLKILEAFGQGMAVTLEGKSA